ncbi:hypothetical protein SAMN02745729_107174 [Marinobacterium iners DSM 11526]|uniref:Uncharacterized protein n=1 Tax=Marinobacterium iners DSM 11526 TaxID=1122198 RepID=A0A1H4E6K8_9GAMM|nr:hypothetical protein SAMN02745729_107174 [Marinobacterium iners DSM 11526]
MSFINAFKLSISKTRNKRMLSDWFSAALQTSRKCGR